MTDPANKQETPDGVDVQRLVRLFVDAARKQEQALHSEYGGWGHSLWCNYQRDIGNGEGRCNCGVSDMLTALKEFDKANATSDPASE